MSVIVCAEPRCPETAKTRGMCRLHYERWKRANPELLVRYKRPLIDRFIESVDASGDCWEWTSERHKRGYGRFYAEGKNWLAHVWLWTYLYGPIAAGKELDHLCRNTSCVNPAHLEAVTHRENMQRGKSPGMLTMLSGVCARGHSMEDAQVAKNGRRCRTCTRERNARYYRERHAA